ncbi:MAG TPA: M28 family peptidase [Terriglobales bacterium]|nr:M28 family peptidase [Terriglobales bacterium]
MIRKLFRPKVLIIVAVIVGLAYLVHWVRIGVRMPGRSYSGRLEPLDAYQGRIRDNLKTHVETLAGTIGERNLQHYDALNQAADYIRQTMESRGYSISEETYDISGKKARILYSSLEGTSTPRKTFIVGAHYDSAVGTPGANDNASGVAALLELGRILKNESPGVSIMFVFFPNEEPPYFQSEQMGSLVFARQLQRRNVAIAGMMSLETIGYYSDQEGSQRYPAPIGSMYPKTGNFIAFVGDTKSRELLQHCIEEFRLTTHFPSEGASLPGWIEGVGWSDHWSFWQIGVPAIMVTDTAAFRDPHNHKADDTPDKLDYDKMARVVLGLKRVIVKVTK